MNYVRINVVMIIYEEYCNEYRTYYFMTAALKIAVYMGHIDQCLMNLKCDKGPGIFDCNFSH